MVHQSEQIVTKTGDEIELTCPVFVPSGQSHPKIIWSIDGLPISSTSMDYQILACFKINFCKINQNVFILAKPFVTNQKNW